jgi:hypothetical protein
MPARDKLPIKVPPECNPVARPFGCLRALSQCVSERRDRGCAMTVDLEEDFENERWRLLALVDWRKSLRDGSEGAIKTDLEIVATRELVRSYETLKGLWSRKVSSRGRQKEANLGPE